MAEGTIKRLTDKGFGFIDNGSGTDMFFHQSAVEGVRFSDLREGQKVSYTEGRGPKGPRARTFASSARPASANAARRLLAYLLLWVLVFRVRDVVRAPAA